MLVLSLMLGTLTDAFSQFPSVLLRNLEKADAAGARLMSGTGGVAEWDSSTSVDSITAGANITLTGAGTRADPLVITASTSPGGGSSSEFARDSLAASPFWATVIRSGGDTTALLTNPAAGRYHIDIPENGSFVSATVFGNNTTLNGSNELEIELDNTANGYRQRLMVQVYDANNGGLVNQFITGTNHTQTVAGFVTTIKLPGMNGFGATGYIIEIR